jgi:hypothetical protein
VIRSRTARGTSTWQVSALPAAGTPTIHDVDALLADIRESPPSGTPDQRPILPGTRAGFLTALAELLDVDRDQGTGDVIQYVFGRQLHGLRVASSRPVDRPAPLAPANGDRAWRDAGLRRSTFEITTAATRRRTTFEMIHATRGPLAGVPTYVTWQPRWWLKVELFLEAPGSDGHRPD